MPSELIDAIKQYNANINRAEPPLTAEQLKVAADHQIEADYPKVDRAFCDPVYRDQLYSLHSFIPAPGATPDADGVYGLLKIRGTFSSEEEANARALDLVQSVDSYNRIFTCKVGLPVPLVSKDFKSNHHVRRINVNDKVADIYKDNIKKKVADEQQRINELKERERLLLEDAKREEEPDIDAYTTLRVKRAQVCMVYLQTISKLKEMRDVVLSCDRQIEDYDRDLPELRETYLKKYEEARESVGLDKSSADSQTFVEYVHTIPAEFYEYDVLKGGKSILGVE